ncbi:MAG: sodium:solute symporter family transporter [Bryobacteraceae bacterium]
MKLAPIDFVIIAAYMAVIAYIVWRTRKFAGESVENYFLGGRNMPGWMTGISYAASMMSADSAVAYGGMAAVTGVYVCWFYLSRFGIALLLGAILFAVFWKRLNTFTTLEFYELRFEGRPAAWMRLWLALRTSLIAMVAWTGISLLALVKLAEPILGWSRTETLLLALPLSVGYVYLSGYVGVVLSNLVQIFVLTLGAVTLAFKVLADTGGPTALGAKLAALNPSMLNTFPPADDAVFPMAACLAWLIGTSIGYGGDAAPMGGAVEGQRILSSRNPKEACIMYLVTEVVLFTLVWLVSVPCLAAVLRWPGLRNGTLDRETAYGLLMTNYLGPGLLGLVFVAMLGGIISVVGDNLNFGSQVLLNDVYRRYLVRDASPRHYLVAGKLALFVILALALLVVYRVQFVFDVAIFMVGLSASEMSANWAQWWWWRFNGWGRVAASFGGGLFYVAMRLLWPEMPWWDRMFASMGVSTALWILTSLATAPERREVLERFYQRARPLGFWGPIAPSSQIRPIGRGLLLALAGAVAVMAYIVSISRAYVGDYRNAVAALVAMMALAAIFWKAFDPFVRSLLSAGEIEQGHVQGATAGATFGLAGLAAVVMLAMAFVLSANAWLSASAAVRSGSGASGAALALGGAILWRKHRRGGNR